MPVSGSVSYSVATADDSVDEADGSVTVTLSSGNGYTVGSAGSASVAVADDDDAPVPQDTPPQPQDPPAVQDSTPQPQPCVSSDSALTAEVAAKVARHATTGRADLLAMFTAVGAALAGEGAYTTGDIRARPDKQGQKWQTGTGLNSLWARIYAELDRLEACRDAQPSQPQDSLPEPSVEVYDGTPQLSEYNNPHQPAQDPGGLPLVVSHDVERLVGYCTSNPSVCTPGIARKVIHRRALSVSVGPPASQSALDAAVQYCIEVTGVVAPWGSNWPNWRCHGFFKAGSISFADRGAQFSISNVSPCQRVTIKAYAISSTTSRAKVPGTEVTQSYVTEGCPRGRWMKATINSTTGSVSATGSRTDPVTGLVPTFELTWTHNPKYSHYCWGSIDDTPGRTISNSRQPIFRQIRRPSERCHEATRLTQNFNGGYFYAIDNRKQFGDLYPGTYEVQIYGHDDGIGDLLPSFIGSATVTIVDTADGSVLPQGTWAGTGVGEQ